MRPKSIWFFICLVVTQLTVSLYSAPILAVTSDENVGKRNQGIEARIDALEKEFANKFDTNEKLVQAKVDQVSAIAENLENGRKNVDWWLNATAIFLGFAGVLAIVIPVMLQRRQKVAFDAEVRNIRETFNSLQVFEREAKAEMRTALADLREAKREVREHLRDTEDAAKKAKSARMEAEAAARTVQKDKTPEELRNTVKKLLKAKDSPVAKLAAKALEFMEVGNWGEAAARWRSLTDIDPDSEGHWFNLAYVLQKHAETVVGTVMKRFYLQESSMAYSEVVRLRPDLVDAYNNWGNCLTSLAETLSPPERPAKFSEAIQKYIEAVRIKPDYYMAYGNWGVALDKWALALPESDQLAKYTEAIQKFSEALRIKPDYHEAYNNWGSTLAKWALTLPMADRPAKFSEAIQKFSEALRIKSDYHEAYSNWSNALTQLAQALPEADRLAKYAEAIQKCAEAVRLKPDSHNPYNNWGVALVEWARLLPEAERFAKYNEALQKYAEAVRLKPDFYEAYNNWGNSILEWSRALPQPERPAKYAEAKEKLLKAEQYYPGAGSYNLACVGALSGNSDEAKYWLENCQKHKTVPNCHHFRVDADLNSLRELEWFKAFMKKECGDKNQRDQAQ